MCHDMIGQVRATIEDMSSKGTRQNPPNEVDELCQMIEAQAAEARIRNEEIRRRDQQMEQQGEMLR